MSLEIPLSTHKIITRLFEESETYKTFDYYSLSGVVGDVITIPKGFNEITYFINDPENLDGYFYFVPSENINAELFSNTNIGIDTTKDGGQDYFTFAFDGVFENQSTYLVQMRVNDFNTITFYFNLEKDLIVFPTCSNPLQQSFKILIKNYNV